MFFSTHTSQANDGFKYVFHEIEVPEILQGSWLYAYFGYSKKAGLASVYMRQRDTEFIQQLAAVHRVPKYLALYTGADGFHPTFNGKLAYMDLMLGV